MKHILIIDDDEDDRTIFCEAVQKIAPDYNCIVADGNSCVAIINGMDSVPDFIFLDIHFTRGVTGVECLAKIKSVIDVERVIVYAGSKNPKIIADFKSQGVTEILIKPDSFQYLCDCLSVIFNSDKKVDMSIIKK
jgi:response regulator of citrate/malate metabolism